MSTRGVVSFGDGVQAVHIGLYKDGYPDEPTGVLGSLEAFFARFEREFTINTPPTVMYDDPWFIAAAFVTHMTQQHRGPSQALLDFLSVRILPSKEGHDCDDYRYEITLRRGMAHTVKWREQQRCVWKAVEIGGSQ